jgi:hypothetical protein
VSDILLENSLKVEQRTERIQGQVSPRESEIISLLAQGKSNKEIASNDERDAETSGALRKVIAGVTGLWNGTKVFQVRARERQGSSR